MMQKIIWALTPGYISLIFNNNKNKYFLIHKMYIYLYICLSKNDKNMYLLYN